MKITINPDAKAILASYEAMSRSRLIEVISEAAPGRCDEDIYQRGSSTAPIFATNMYATEFLCELLRKMTGARIDWHYVGGRVNMLLHPDDKALSDKVKEAVEMIGICSLNDPQDSFYARVYEIEREEIVAAFRGRRGDE